MHYINTIQRKDVNEKEKVKIWFEYGQLRNVTSVIDHGFDDLETVGDKHWII